MAQANRQQHIVPVQMIRRFAAADGCLSSLFKPQLRLGTRRKRPKGILFHDDYYTDSVGDFDDLLRPIEDRFARHWAHLASIAETLDWPDWPTETLVAFVDWVAALLSRTQIMDQGLPLVFSQEYPELQSAMPAHADVCRNLMRADKWLWYQELFLRPLWCWRPRDIHCRESFIITDNPVCQLITDSFSGPLVYIVPLTKTRVFFGGMARDVERATRLPTSYINFCLAGWADRQIYCADDQTLAQLVAALKGEGEPTVGRELCDAARKPFFGVMERLAANPLPQELVREEEESPMADRFGPSIFR